MTDDEKKQLFEHSETLKNHALELFPGQDSIRVAFGLLHAASQIIKTDSMPYKESLMRVLNILLHLEDCSGCEDHKDSSNEL